MLRVARALSSLVLLSHAAKHSQCVVHLNGAPCTSGASYPVGAGDVIAFAPKLCWTVVPVSVAPSPLRSSSRRRSACAADRAGVARARSPVEDEGGASASAMRSKPQKGKGKKKAEEEGKDGVEDDADSAPVSAPAAQAAPAASEPDTPVGVTCPICCEPLAVAVTLSCGHALCHECAVGLQAHAARERVKCPECRQPHKREARRCFALDAGRSRACGARAVADVARRVARARARPVQGSSWRTGRRAVARGEGRRGVVERSTMTGGMRLRSHPRNGQQCERCAVNIAMHIGIAPSGRRWACVPGQPIQREHAPSDVEAGAEHGGAGGATSTAWSHPSGRCKMRAEAPPRRAFALRLLTTTDCKIASAGMVGREPLSRRCAFMDAAARRCANNAWPPSLPRSGA